jgi:hypothetical protein
LGTLASLVAVWWDSLAACGVASHPSYVDVCIGSLGLAEDASMHQCFLLYMARCASASIQRQAGRLGPRRVVHEFDSSVSMQVVLGQQLIVVLLRPTKGCELFQYTILAIGSQKCAQSAMGSRAMFGGCAR